MDSTGPGATEPKTEGSTPGEPAGRLPWFEQVLREPLVSAEPSPKMPWRMEVFMPLGFLPFLAFLYVGGSVPRSIGGHVSFFGLVSMFGAGSLLYFARRAREHHGPMSRRYRLVGSAFVLLFAGGWLAAGTGLLMVLL